MWRFNFFGKPQSQGFLLSQTSRAFRLQTSFFDPVKINLIPRSLRMLHFSIYDAQMLVSFALLEIEDNFWTTEVRSPALPLNFVFASMSRPNLGLIFNLNKSVTVCLTTEWNWSGREAHHLSLDSAEISNKWTYTYSSIYIHNYGTLSQGHVL